MISIKTISLVCITYFVTSLLIKGVLVFTDIIIPDWLVIADNVILSLLIVFAIYISLRSKKIEK